MNLRPLLAAMLLLSTTGVVAREPKSGYDYLQQATRDIQDDDFANPGMATVEAGRTLFHTVGENGQHCGSCHGENGAKLDPKRVASYPVFDADSQRPLTLQGRINRCWEDRLDNQPLLYGSSEAIVLETFVRHLAQGERVNVDVDGPLKPFYDAGRQLYQTRYGQTNLACTHCHDQYAGRMLRGQMLSQGQSNGFPEYRLGSGKVTSLHARMQECMSSFRARPFERGSAEFINLEVYVNARGNGLPIETPGVRY